MIDSKLLVTPSPDSGVDAYVLWGFWIPRKGDNLVVAMEVAANVGAQVYAELYQKNYDEVGDGTATGESLTFDQTTGRQVLTKLGAKELVRFQLTIARGGDLPTDALGWFLFRFLQPVWFESVKV